jgi:hypothetical protein
VQLYALAGNHQSTVAQAPNAFGSAQSVQESKAAKLPAKVSFDRNGPPDASETYRIRVFGRADLLRDAFVGLALDPDLGRRPEDDSLGVDSATGLVWVSDPDSGWIGYVLRGLPNGTRTTVRQFSTQKSTWRPDPPSDEAAYYELAASTPVLTGRRDDVRFLVSIAVGELSSRDLEFDLVILRAPTLDRLRQAASIAIASAGSPAGSGAETSTLNNRFRLVQAPPEPAAHPGLARISSSLVPGLAEDGRALASPSSGLREAVRKHGITALAFAVPKGAEANVRIRIYSSTGQFVRTLLDETEQPGSYRVQWDKKDERGVLVAPGVYVAIMEAPGFRATTKLVIIP